MLAGGTRPNHKDYVFPTTTHMHPILGRTWGKVHVHLAPNHGLLFLDLAAALVSVSNHSPIALILI